MGEVELPESLLVRFRAVSYERLERIDNTWIALTHGTAARGAEDDAYRDLHTLKGDARVVGFVDVAVLCQRLEDLLNAARGRQYRVHEEVDIVVTMSIQFIGMLLRKKAGASRSGIDLEGFLTQIEEVLSESFRRPETPAAPPVAPHLRLADAPGRGGLHTSHRLCSVATTVYLEHLRTTGRSRARLRDAWNILVRELEGLEWVPIAPLFERHAAAASLLASELGKEVSLATETQNVRVSADVLDTLNTTVLHALRNAVDHGVEPPPLRRARGKDAAGRIRVMARSDGDAVEVVIADDGQGIDLDRVRRSATGLGLIAKGETVSDGELLELVFHPGLSTRDAVSTTSGRGVGMDAVRAAVTRLGGTVNLQSCWGLGASLTIRLPQTRSTIDVHAFRSPRANLLFAVDAEWMLDQNDVPVEDAVDAVTILELPSVDDPDRPPSAPRAIRLRHVNAEVTLLVGASHPGGTAQRLCMTTQEDPLEVVSLEGEDALLLRPAVLLALSRRERGATR